MKWNPGRACLVACILPVIACIGDVGEVTEEPVAQVSSAITVFGAKLLPSAYTLRFPDAQTDCGDGHTLSHILRTEPRWKWFSNTNGEWTHSAGALLDTLGKAIAVHTEGGEVDAKEHTAAYWALMAAHDSAPDQETFDVKLISAHAFLGCRLALFGSATRDDYLFVVAGDASIDSRAWYLNTGRKTQPDPFSPYTLDDALVCFADPANEASAGQAAIWDGERVWLIADPPRSGVTD